MRQSQPSSQHSEKEKQQTTNATQTVENADISIGPILSGHPLFRNSDQQQTPGLLFPFELQLLPSRNKVDETRLSLSIGMETPMPSYEKGEASLLGEKVEARREAKRQIEIAEFEFAEAKRIRQHAKAELHKAQLYREEASRRISATLMQLTCHNCKQHFQGHAPSVHPPPPPLPPQTHCTDESTSLAVSYVSSATTTEGEKVSDRASS